MVEGKTNPEIAEILSVSRATVKTHVSNILGKLNVSSRVEAVKLALEKKLI
jgi:DNA-binding NarL/FixJ family response regulator